MRRRLACAILLGVSGVLAVTRSAGAQPRTGVSTLVVLVRHAEKGTVPADDPSITEAGQARARALAELLSDAHVTAIITSPRRRATETALPLAQARGLTPEVIALDTGHVNAVAAAVRRHAGEVVLVVGHSNTIPAIIAALGGPKMPDLCDAVYSSLFVMEIGGAPRNAGDAKAAAHLVRGQFGAADPAGADQCRATTPR
jgi:broad specificity phosphatase PhoE